MNPTQLAEKLAKIAAANTNEHSHGAGINCTQCELTAGRILQSIPLVELLECVSAMRQECAKFRFPDEDRPLLHNALTALNAKLKEILGGDAE